MVFVLFLALRGLLHSRWSLGMLLSAVAAGAGLQIPNSANLDGYSQELFDKGVVRAFGHVQVTPRDEPTLLEAGARLALIRALPGVQAAHARLLHGGVVFLQEAQMPVRVVGLDLAAEQHSRGFCEQLEAGRCLAGAGAPGLILGHGAAEHLRARVGDRVRLVLPYDDLGEVEFRKLKLEVRGVLAPGGGFSATDLAAFVDLADLQAWLGREDEASGIQVFVADPGQAEPLARRISAALGDAQARPWWQVDSFVASAIEGNQTISTISMLMVILAVLIPVLALLTISVLAERRQIATLAALGVGRRTLFGLYLARAGLVGLVGTALGGGLGLGLCAWFEAHPIFERAGFAVRPVLDPASVLLPLGVVLGVTLLGGLLPALRAAWACPVHGLKEV
jgi:lipoprotein-releasing system permease protein